MTKIAHRVFRQLYAALSDGEGGLRQPLHPAARDGYAALWIWMSAGQPVERITPDDVGPIPADLRLDTPPLARQAVGYILPDPADWLVLARLQAGEAVRVGSASYAYPEPMLAYAGWRGGRGSIVSGCVNLVAMPTIASMRLGAGRNFGELASADLTQGEADEDLLMAAICFRRFFGVHGV